MLERINPLEDQIVKKDLCHSKVSSRIWWSACLAVQIALIFVDELNFVDDQSSATKASLKISEPRKMFLRVLSRDPLSKHSDVVYVEIMKCCHNFTLFTGFPVFRLLEMNEIYLPISIVSISLILPPSLILITSL